MLVYYIWTMFKLLYLKHKLIVTNLQEDTLQIAIMSKREDLYNPTE